MFGYHLGFGKIPYSPNGPPAVTPFILSVLCLASSKRSSEYRQLVGPLHGEVSELLRQCTLTGSIFGFDSLPVQSDAMGENWDPELGIGPEETVGCAVLALFSDDRKDARLTSATALKWAEGLIKVRCECHSSSSVVDKRRGEDVHYHRRSCWPATATPEHERRGYGSSVAAMLRKCASVLANSRSSTAPKRFKEPTPETKGRIQRTPAISSQRRPTCLTRITMTPNSCSKRG